LLITTTLLTGKSVRIRRAHTNEEKKEDEKGKESQESPVEKIRCCNCEGNVIGRGFFGIVKQMMYRGIDVAVKLLTVIAA